MTKIFAGRSRMTENAKSYTLDTIISNSFNHLRIKITGEMGRCLYANRDFKVGEVVLMEMAYLASSGTDLHACIGILLQNPGIETQLDLFDALGTDNLAEFPKIEKEVNELYKRLESKVDFDFLTHLVSAFRKNGHGIKNNKFGLFVIGSKAAHSCAPNVCATGSNEDQIQFIAVKPIKKGDLITYPYYLDSPKLALPRDIRQALLITQDIGFKCVCVRCLGSDEVRMFRCIQSNCCGNMSLRYNDDVFRCDTCKSVTTSDELPLEFEQAMSNKVMVFELSSESWKSDEIIDFLGLCTDRIGPDHWAVFLLEMAVLKMIIKGTLIISKNKQNCIIKHFVEWLDTYMYPVCPVAVCDMLHIIVKGGLIDLQTIANVSLMSKSLPILEFVYGANSKHVALWRAVLLANK